MRLRATARRLQCMDTNMNTPQPPNGPHAGWAQPAPAPKKKPIYKRVWFIIVAAIAGLAVLAVIALAAFSMWLDHQLEMVEAGMIDACHEEVQKQAKYPGGVEFVETEVVKGEGIDDLDLRRAVHGFVDFPNGFGTPVRHGYICGVDFNDSDNPTVHAIVIKQ